MVGGYGAQRARDIATHGQAPSASAQNQSHVPPVSSGKFDGPDDARSQSGRQNPFGSSIGFDPARDSRPVVKKGLITNTRVELPSAAYRLDSNVSTALCFLEVQTLTFLLFSIFLISREYLGHVPGYHPVCQY